MAQYSESHSSADPMDLPYSLDAEQSVLGAILIDEQCLALVMEQVTRPDMFFINRHVQMYSILLKMYNLSTPIDFVTVLNELTLARIFEDEGSAKVYLVQLMEMVPSTSNTLDYCKIISEHYYRRKLMTAALEIVSKTREEQGTAEQLLDMAEQQIYDIRHGKQSADLIPIDKVIISAYDHLQKITGEDKERYLGLKSGFSRLDTMTTGLNRSDLILIAARPGMGKTSFVLNVAVNVARHYPEKEVALFSLEMSNEQLITRMLSSEARISSELLRTGRLSPEQWLSLAKSADLLSQTNIFLDDTPGITSTEIKAKTRRLSNLGLVVIDYLQLMSGGSKNENRVQEVSKITRSLKIMAKELNVPVVVLSQLNRSAEQRPDHRPLLADLRESGSIEQDADIVMFLFREGYYDPEVENPNLAKCILAKNRHGSTGDTDLLWDGQFTRFADLEVYREAPAY